MCYVNLTELVKLSSDEDVCEQYVKYLLKKESLNYKHTEINSLKVLIEELDLDKVLFNGFQYSYVIPHLDKEFDLLRFHNDFILNIELKSKNVGQDKIIKQLSQNRHYLSIFGLQIIQFCFISSSKTLLSYDGGNLIESSISELKMLLSLNKDFNELNLDDYFSAKNMLISPLNTPVEFFEGKYLLTDDQNNKKKQILDLLKSNTEYLFLGITGDAGTGKTLLMYDIANEVSKAEKILIIHCGILCEGHKIVTKINNNIDIIAAKDVRNIELADYNKIFVDESQRFYSIQLEFLKESVIKNNCCCVFSFDEKQRLSKFENNSETVEELRSLCDNNLFKLSKSIRVNKELIMFINGLFDMNKIPEKRKYDSVNIIYEESNKKAVNLAILLNDKDYKYICYTPSKYYSDIDYQVGSNNAHEVIGQEFDNVCMIINEDFYYEDKKLKSKTHPNPDYIYTKMLYQGLTRARKKITLIITNKKILSEILKTIAVK